MSYWDTKVLPKIKKIFEKNGTKKAGAAEACKSFDEIKERIIKEFEDKKAELKSKVLEIYEASPPAVKTLIKERKVAGLKKNSTAVNKFLEELGKIEFPGSKAVSEACSKFGPQMVSGPVFFVFEKISTFIGETPPAPAEEKKVEEASAAEETSTRKDKEIVVEEEKKKEEAAAEDEAEKPVTSEAAPAAPAAATEPEKKEESEPPKTT